MILFRKHKSIILKSDSFPMLCLVLCFIVKMKKCKKESLPWSWESHLLQGKSAHARYGIIQCKFWRCELQETVTNFFCDMSYEKKIKTNKTKMLNMSLEIKSDKKRSPWSSEWNITHVSFIRKNNCDNLNNLMHDIKVV